MVMKSTKIKEMVFQNMTCEHSQFSTIVKYRCKKWNCFKYRHIDRKKTTAEHNSKNYSIVPFLILIGMIAISHMDLVFADDPKNVLSGTSDHPSYTVKQTSGSVKTDGVLLESAWRDATCIKIPFEYLPGDNVPPPVETDFLITFDEKNLYMAFKCYDPDPSRIRAHLMDRDAWETLIQDDHVVVMIDFFNDERRAFSFVSIPWAFRPMPLSVNWKDLRISHGMPFGIRKEK